MRKHRPFTMKKKVVYRKNFEESMKLQGNMFLEEAYLYESLYYKSVTILDQNLYFNLMCLYLHLAAYEFGFSNTDDMCDYLDDRIGRRYI